MKKQIFFFFFLQISLTTIGQDNKLKEILGSYNFGQKTKTLIEKNKLAELKSEFEQTENINSLISLIKSNNLKELEYELHSDIYFNPDLKKYVFTIYCSKWIKTNSDWGLNDYLFIIELLIHHNKSMNQFQITSRKILDQNSDLKKWWQSLMDTYKKPKFQRNKWAEMYDLVPPPPPPPQTTEWFKK